MKLALLVIDLQEEFFEDARSRESLDAALEYVNHVIGLFRNAEQPVFYIQDEEAGEGPGSAGFELHSGLEVLPSAPCLNKTACNAFWKTDLEAELKKETPDLLVICGYAAEACIWASYNGAVERGLPVNILQNGIAGTKPEYVRLVSEITNLISYQTIAQILSS